MFVHSSWNLQNMVSEQSNNVSAAQIIVLNLGDGVLYAHVIRTFKPYANW